MLVCFISSFVTSSNRFPARVRLWGLILVSGCLIRPALTNAVLIPLELFESQGCSSCPPAEKVLAQLDTEYGSDVLPLSFHVDYWDSLGWKDPFSSKSATQRQDAYVKALPPFDMYTPQMVVQGEVAFNGSDGAQARREIEKRRKKTMPELSLEAKGSLASGGLTVSFQLPESLAPLQPSVTVVIYENTTEIHVRKGENAGRVMSGRYVVRDFWTIPGRYSPVYQIPIQLKPFWNTEHTGIAILVSGDPSAILTAARFYPVQKALRP